MRQLFRAFAVALLATVVSGLSCNVFRARNSCETNQDCERGTACNAAGRFCAHGAPIRIGAVLPLSGSGRLRQTGAACRVGLEFASDWLQSRGAAPLGRGIEWVFADDTGQQAVSLEQTKRLLDDGVLAIVGSTTSAHVLATQRLTFERKVLHVVPFAGAQGIPAAQGALGERFLFSLSPTIANGSPLGLVRYLVDENAAGRGPRCRNTLVFNGDDVTSADFYCTFAKQFASHGMCVTRRIVVPFARKGSYEAEVAELRAHAPDCLILGTAPDVAAYVLEEIARQVGPKPPWTLLGNSAVHSQGLLSALGTQEGPSLAEGMVGADVDFAPDSLPYRELAISYAQRSQDRGTDSATVPYFVSPCADIGFLLALAIEHAGAGASPESLRDSFLAVAGYQAGDQTFSPGQIVAAMALARRRAAIDYQGASSDVEFDVGGTMQSAPSNIWRVEGNGFNESVRKYTDRDLRSLEQSQQPTPNCAPPPAELCPGSSAQQN